MPPIFKFEVEGKRIPIEDIQDAFIRHNLEDWQAVAEKGLGEIVCPTHKLAPTIIFKYPSPGDMLYSVEACCPEFQTEVRARILLRR